MIGIREITSIDYLWVIGVEETLSDVSFPNIGVNNSGRLRMIDFAVFYLSLYKILYVSMYVCNDGND
jgi:hypothetical protein